MKKNFSELKKAAEKQLTRGKKLKLDWVAWRNSEETLQEIEEQEAEFEEANENLDSENFDEEFETEQFLRFLEKKFKVSYFYFVRNIHFYKLLKND